MAQLGAETLDGVVGAFETVQIDRGKSVATPGQFAGSAAKRCWYARMVWRGMPVARSISRWAAPPLGSVQMVVCRCGFKTFTPCFPRSEGVEDNVLPVGLLVPDAPDSMHQFTVAKWRSLGGHKLGSLSGRRRSAHLQSASLIEVRANEVGLPEIAQPLWGWKHTITNHPVQRSTAYLQCQARLRQSQ